MKRTLTRIALSSTFKLALQLNKSHNIVGICCYQHISYRYGCISICNRNFNCFKNAILAKWARYVYGFLTLYSISNRLYSIALGENIGWIHESCALYSNLHTRKIQLVIDPIPLYSSSLRRWMMLSALQQESNNQPAMRRHPQGVRWVIGYVRAQSQHPYCRVRRVPLPVRVGGGWQLRCVALRSACMLAHIQTTPRGEVQLLLDPRQ